MLYSHEYTQAAGRAGRLGLDAVGNVIHLNNLFRNIETMTSYKTMMSGKPPTLKSKFKISYNLLLNLIDIGDNNFINFARKSMVKDDLDSELKEIYYAISREQTQLDTLETTMKMTRTPVRVIEEYLKLIESQKTSVNKKRKEIERQIETIRDQYVNIEFDKLKVEKYNQKLRTIDDLQEQYNFVEKYIDNNVQTIVNLLEDDGFVQLEDETNASTLSLTTRGMIATHLKESHCLVFAKLFEENA
jgi:superfamily II RNA helicase